MLIYDSACLPSDRILLARCEQDSSFMHDIFLRIVIDLSRRNSCETSFISVEIHQSGIRHTPCSTVNIISDLCIMKLLIYEEFVRQT